MRFRSHVIAAVVAVFMAIPATRVHAHDVYGNIQIKNLETGRVRTLDRMCKIEVQTDDQLIKAITRPDGTYLVHIRKDGVWTLTLHYRSRRLTTEIGSDYNPNRYDLIIGKDGDEYWLWTVYVPEYRLREDRPQ